MSTPEVSTSGSSPMSTLRYAVQRLSRRLRRHAGEEMTAPHLAVLSAVDRHGVMRPGDLARHEQIGKSNMTRLVDRLEADGLVVRSAVAEDGRGMAVSLTDLGRTALREANRQQDAYLEAQLAMLDAADRDAILAAVPALERLLAIRA